MSPLSRRTFCTFTAGATGAWLLSGRPLWSAEARVVGWPSRVVQLPPDDDNHKPPVITAVRLHKDGRELATAGDDHLVRVWSLEDGKLLRKLDYHTDWVRTIDYSPDGTLLASGGNDRRLIFWDAATGARKEIFALHGQAIAAIRFSHSGELLAALGFEGTIKLYNVAGRQVLLEPAAPCQDMRAVAFSPDDSLLAVGGRSGVVRVISTQSGQMLRDVAAHRLRVRAVEFSSDGSYIASAGEDRLIHVLPLADGATGFTLPQRPAKVLALSFYGPNHLAAAGSDNLVRLWDVAQQEELGLLSGHTGSVAALECHDKVLISAGYDTTVRVWSIADRVAGAESVPPKVGRAIESVPRAR